MWSQVSLHHYKQSYWRWWNSSRALSNPKRWCIESGALNMPANLENSAVATGLEKVSFHSNPKERQCQRVFMLLLLLNCFSRVRLCATPQTAAHQAPLSLEFSRKEHWSGLPVPSPMHESEKWKWSRSVISNSQRPHGLQPTRVLHPRDFPGKSTGVGCHCLLQKCSYYCTIVLISHTSKVMLKILYRASTVREPWTSRCSSWF